LTSSIVMYARPSRSPTSYTATTFGWVSRAIARASAASRSWCAAPRNSSCSTFSATLRSSTRSYAFHTFPIPPTPIGSSNTYRSGPAVAGVSAGTALAGIVSSSSLTRRP
jgi:hypothetical protein